MAPSPPYVRYADGVEETQPNKEQLGDEIVASMARMARLMFEKNRHAIRDAHARSHGILRGELHVHPNLPAHLAQGMFKEANVYPVIIRLSTSPGAIEPDSQPAVKGLALKVIGVPGQKFLAAEADAVTQDFLLVQDAFSPARRVYADDVLSFNPFHCLPEHRPLGSINRVRIKAYESSAAYRHTPNAQPRTEPTDISQLPD